ncbi:MAG: T9SS-dependent M36 family metallopeptidase [Bacteroidota bacterium]
MNFYQVLKIQFILIFFSILSFNFSQAQDLDRLVWDHIEATSDYYGLSEADLFSWKPFGQYESQHNGLHHYFFRQVHNGIDVHNADINVNIKSDGRIIFMRNQFFPQMAQRNLPSSPSISHEEAINLAAQYLTLTPPQSLEPIEVSNDPDQYMLFNNNQLSVDPIPVKLSYYPKSRKELALCWQIRIHTLDRENWWTIWLDATTGEYIDRENWVTHCVFHTEDAICTDHIDNNHTISSNHTKFGYKRFPKNNAGPNEYEVYAVPVESPSHGGRSIVSNPAAQASNASPFGWHDTNGIAGADFTITRGNNVHAYQDRNDADSDSNDEPDGGPTLDFTGFPLDLSLAPINYVDAAVINLFYWCNIMHDVWYQYGFDESAGNFQSMNYGSNGIGGDYIRAEAQDAADLGTRNNANFSSGPDGSFARIQMYLWSAPPSPNIFTVNSPGSVSGSYTAIEAAFGSGLNVTPIIGNLVEVSDGTGSPTLGCNALTNGAAISGNIALIDRGTCEFGTKVLNAENAGAIAAVVCNNVGGGPITMGPGANGNLVTIPSIMISMGDCATIRAQLPGVNVTLVNSGSAPERDGDLDNGIIAHEYGHGISNRLTGGPEAICLGNEEQMGEGWSDWFGLMMTLEAGDVETDPRGMGTYAIGEGVTGTGIRPAPYSTDFALNNYDYSDLGNGEISVPHGVGFIWATMLWDLTWALIDVYGFDPNLYTGVGGNNFAMQLVMDGMKIQGCSPGFVDGRDAILAADVANYDGIHECLIWEVFATRGLGFSASQGDANSRSDGTAAFDLPPGLTGLSLVKSVDFSEVPVGGTLTYALQARNLCETNTSVSITDVLPSNLTYVANSASGGGSEAGGTVSYPVIPSLAPSSTSSLLFFQGTVDVGSYFPPNILLSDDIEGGPVNWNTAGSTGAGTWVISGTNPNSGSSAAYAQDFATQSDQLLTLNVAIPLTGLTTLTFQNYYDTEVTWDGGVVEISTDNGTTWEDLGPSMTQNGYNSFINANPQSAISQRPAFSGNSNGYIETRIELCDYSGQNALIRFRFASDGFVGGDGWYIDDITFISEAAVVNIGTVTAINRSAEASVCSKIILLLAAEEIGIEAKAQKDHILVNWGVVNSELINYYLERSDNPLTGYSQIAEIGRKEGSFDDKFLDFDAEPFTDYYYRLKWRDQNGGTGYSDVVSAKLIATGLTLNVNPNPVREDFFIQVITPTGGNFSLSLYSINGTRLVSKEIEIPSGKSELEMSSEQLAKGVYILVIENEQEVSQVKIVKN